MWPPARATPAATLCRLESVWRSNRSLLTYACLLVVPVPVTIDGPCLLRLLRLGLLGGVCSYENGSPCLSGGRNPAAARTLVARSPRPPSPAALMPDATEDVCCAVWRRRNPAAGTLGPGSFIREPLPRPPAGAPPERSMMVMARRRHDGRGRRRSGSGRPSYAGGAYSTQQPQPSVRARELHAVGLDPGEHDALDEAADVCHQELVAHRHQRKVRDVQRRPAPRVCSTVNRGQGRGALAVVLGGALTTSATRGRARAGSPSSAGP